MGTSPSLFESVLFEPYPRSIRGLRYPLPDQLPQVEAAQRDRWLRDAERRAGTRLATAVDELVGGPEADGLLGLLVTKHGVFVSRFFGRAIMPVVTAALARHPNSVVDLFRLFASELRGEPFQLAEWWEGAEPNQSVVENCMEEFLYDQAPYRLVTTQVGLDAMRSWFNEASNPRHCVVCSSQKPFRVVDMAEWLYANAGGYMHCCFQCGLLERESAWWTTGGLGGDGRLHRVFRTCGRPGVRPQVEGEGPTCRCNGTGVGPPVSRGSVVARYKALKVYPLSEMSVRRLACMCLVCCVGLKLVVGSI